MCCYSHGIDHVKNSIIFVFFEGLMERAGVTKPCGRLCENDKDLRHSGVKRLYC